MTISETNGLFPVCHRRRSRPIRIQRERWESGGGVGHRKWESHKRQFRFHAAAIMGRAGRGLVRSFKRIFPHVLRDDRAWDHVSCAGFAPSRFSTLSEGRRGVVAVGMSGGVDSSVAALLLQRQVRKFSRFPFANS